MAEPRSAETKVDAAMAYYRGYSEKSIMNLERDVSSLRDEVKANNTSLSGQMETLKGEVQRQKLGIARLVGAVLLLFYVGQWLLGFLSPMLQQLVLQALKSRGTVP